MRKYIKFNILGLMLIVMALVSCDQASQDASPVVSPAGYPVATFTTDFSGGSVSEGDTITYTVTLDKTIDRSVTFRAKLISGTITEDDIEIIPGTLAPYQLSTTVSIVFLQDWENDPSETAKFEIATYGIAEKNLLNTATVSPVFDVTVGNYVSEVLMVSLDWHQPVTVVHIISKKIDLGGYSITIRDTVDVAKDAGASIDYDFYLCPAADFATDPWGTEVGNYTAATGDMPEIMKVEGLDNGEYVIFYEVFSNALNTVTAPTTFKQYKDSTQLASVYPSFVRQGTSLDLEIEMDPDETAPIWAERAYGYIGVVAKIIVADGKYTIEDYEGTTSGPWKGITPPESSRKHKK